MPFEVEVGVRAARLTPAAINVCQAPGVPPELPPQADPVPESSPADDTCTHWVAAEARLSKVTAPEANNVPINRVLPTTPRVVDGTFVPMPTRPVTPSTYSERILFPLDR